MRNQPYCNRNSDQRCSMKEGVLRNFKKFTGKHLHQSLFLNKVAGLHRRFPVNFEIFLRTPLFIEHLWWLLLNKAFSLIKIDASDEK